MTDPSDSTPDSRSAASLFSTAALAQPLVAEAPLRAHLSFLADDLLEGRGTGQRGGDLAVRYLETQAAVAGLQPLKDGSYRQALTIVGSKALPSSTVTFSAGGKTLSPMGVGNRAGQGICRVGARLGIQGEQAADHVLDLCFGRVAVANHGLLDL